MLLAIVGNGVAGAMYIGSQLGPGPRDGLMTGLARRTGRSIRLVRTSLEITVVVLGFALGGIVGVGTVLYALLIGPVVQLFLPVLTVRVERPAARGQHPQPAATEPAGTGPAVTEPAGTGPAVTEPAVTEPAVTGRLSQGRLSQSLLQGDERVALRAQPGDDRRERHGDGRGLSRRRRARRAGRRPHRPGVAPARRR